MTIRVNDKDFQCSMCLVTVTDLLYIKLNGVHEVLPIAEAFSHAESILCDGKDYSNYSKLYRVELDRVQDMVCHVGLMRPVEVADDIDVE